METIISNNITIKNPSLALESWVVHNLTIVNPKWETLMRIGKQDQIMWYHIQKDMALYIRRGNDLIVPFGVLPRIWNFVKNDPYRLDLNNAGAIRCVTDKITQELYDYQEEAVTKMLAAKGGILVAPCSAGKTNMMTEIIHRIGKKFLFLVHTSDLLRQFYERAKSLYPNMDIGRTTDGKVDFGRDGTVATIQTMDKIDVSLYRNEFDVVVCDECVHVAGSPTLSKMFSRVIGSIPARYKFGCTATPERTDSMTKTMYTTLGVNPLGEFAPVYVIDKSKTKSLTAEHIKVETGVKFDYCILNEDGSFNYNNLIEYLSFDENRNNLIVQKTAEMVKDNRKTVVLCHRIEQCETLHKKLLDAGIKSELLVGKVSSKNRDAILKEERDWDVIVATYSLMKEGIDIKSLEAEILCTPVNDKGMTIQCAGRVERFKEGKRTPLVLDLCDEKIPYCVNRFKKRVGYLRKRY